MRCGVPNLHELEPDGRLAAGAGNASAGHVSCPGATGAGRRYTGMVMLNDSPVVHSDPEIMGGTAVFVGTRVPVQSLFDYLEAGDTLDEFVRQFPSVRREQAIDVLEIARRMLLTSARLA